MSTADSRSAVSEEICSYIDQHAYPFALFNGESHTMDHRQGFLQDVTTYANIWFKQPEHNDIEEFLQHFPPVYNWDYFDNKAMWHRNATPVYAAFRAHCLRLIKQWKHETALHRYLSEKPFLATALGFDGIPSQDRLWKDWNRYFSEDDRKLIAEAAEEIVNIARYRNVPAPDEVFRPDETAGGRIAIRTARACATSRARRRKRSGSTPSRSSPARTTCSATRTAT